MNSAVAASRSATEVIDSPRLLIRASAGTGKTFQLSSRYIALLRQAPPEKILSSTFTRKAAGEILERILLRLARATASARSLQELGTSIGVPGLSREECLQMLAQLTRQLHRVRISTLDAFFAQLAGSHALELGFPSGWRILDPVEVQQLRAQALEQMLHEGDQQELVQLMHMLDKGDSSRSVSGLMRQTIDDMYYVFVDSTEAAWDRFPEHHFLSEEAREELLQGMAQLQLDQKRMQTALVKDCLAIREERWSDFLQKGLLPKIRSSERTYYNKPIPEVVCEYYLQLSEHCLAVTAASWKQQTRAAWRLLNDFHTVFERLKQSAGGLEFGDVTRRLSLGQNPESRRDITFRMDGAIEHLLLDEFQDTSRPQWEVIRGFAEEACRRPQHSFFCVGDIKQAIYGWRGGEAAIFDAIEKQLPGLESQPLNLSYRSSPIVIDAVNQAMTRLHQHDNLDDHAVLLHQWGRNFPHHETSRKELSGYVCLRTGPEAPETEDGAPSSREQKNEFWKFSADYVADLARRSPYATIGVLTRGNAAVGRMIFELNRLGIDASEEGGNPLTDSAGVQLLLSLMKFVDHPGDTISAFHVARSPLGNVLGFHDHADSQNVIEFTRRFRERLSQHGYGRVIHDLARQLAPVCNRREYRRLLQLAGLADRFDTLFSTLRPTEFVRYAEVQRCEDPSNARVRVMTIHQSKGLEFDIVVLPELGSPLMLPPRYVTQTSSPGGPPELVALYRSEEHFNSLGGDLLAARMQTRDRMLQEAMCLLYVAMTRAARALHMLVSPKVTAHHPKTFAGLLRAALAPGVPLEPMKLLWEHGDPHWDAAAQAHPQQKRPATPAADEKSLPAVTLRFASPTTKRHLKRTTPTQQKTGQRISFSIGTAQSGLSGAERGSLFHRWLQDIIWIDAQTPDVGQLQRVVRMAGLPDQELDSQLEQFQHCLQQPALKQLLRPQGYAERLTSLARLRGRSPEDVTIDVLNEFPFILSLPTGELMQGNMDRFVIFKIDGHPVGAEVVDFKTDQAATPADQSRLVEFYRGQLKAYQQAAAQLLGIDSGEITLRLAFVSHGIVVEL